MADFLTSFLKLAVTLTEAGRGFVVDTGEAVVAKHQLDEAVMQSEDFRSLAYTTMQQAQQQGTAIITNNIITDPNDAPNTNTSFANLRMVVAFPVFDQGVVYLDKLIRHGIIESSDLDNLVAFARRIVDEGKTHFDYDELHQHYQQVVAD